MRIGLVARKAGVGVETVRFYERKGLIARPARPEGGFRSYPAEAVDRIRFVRHAQDIGFSLAEITDLLSLRADPATDCADIRARAAEKRADVQAKIDRLVHMRDALDELIASCPGGGDVKSCTIIEAMNGSARSGDADGQRVSGDGKRIA